MVANIFSRDHGIIISLSQDNRLFSRDSGINELFIKGKQILFQNKGFFPFY